jgi:hypothetical protein
MPFVDVHHAVAAVYFHHRRNQRDRAVANFADVRAFVHGEAVSQLHQRGGRTGFRGMDRSGDVVDRHGLRDELFGFRIIHLDRARVGQLREPGAIFFEVSQIIGRRDSHRDHLAPFFRRADRKNLHAGTGFLQQAHVLVHVLGVGQHAGRARDVAQHRFGSRHGLGRRKVVDERRSEIRRRGVLLNLRRVSLVDGLLGIAGRGRFVARHGRARCGKQNQQQECIESSCDFHEVVDSTSFLLRFLPARRRRRRRNHLPRDAASGRPAWSGRLRGFRSRERG